MQSEIRTNQTKRIQYPFSNRLVFAIIMQQETLCKELLRRIFSNKEILQIKFQEETEAETSDNGVQVEKTILNGISAKSIRLDVLFSHEIGWADIELQVQREKHLPKRSRYYHASTDLHILPAGENYERLKSVYVIFICFFDFFGLGEPVYEFEMYNVKTSLPLGDESYTLILNIMYEEDKVPKQLKTLYAYLKSGEADEKDTFIQKIHGEVAELNQREELKQVMTLEEEYRMEKQRSLEEGIEIGKDQGIEIGLQEGKKSIARKLKESGMEIQQIVEMTDLSVEEIEKL